MRQLTISITFQNGCSNYSFQHNWGKLRSANSQKEWRSELQAMMTNDSSKLYFQEQVWSTRSNRNESHEKHHNFFQNENLFPWQPPTLEEVLALILPLRANAQTIA